MVGMREKLDSLRGAAAVYVVLHHTIPYSTQLGGLPVGHLMRFGQEAVIMFFLLSGFVINYSFTLAKKKSFSNYFSKRFSRIYIPLLVVMFVSYFASSYEAGQLLNPDLKGLAGNLLMLQDWSVANPNVLVDPYMGNGPLWSLSYEWWFYMLFFPITVYYKDKLPLDTLVFSSSVIASLVYVFYPHFAVRIIMYFAIWWAGAYIAAAYISERHREFNSLLAPCLTLACISLVLGINAYLFVKSGDKPIFYGIHPFNELRHFVFALIAIVGGWFWMRLGWKLFRFTLGQFKIFAPISYAIYICHDPIMRDVSYLSFIDNPVLRWVGYFSIMLLLSYLIEIILYPAVRSWLQPRLERRMSSWLSKKLSYPR